MINKTIVFNGAVKEFDAIYWKLMQGFEQYMASPKNNRSIADKVKVIGPSRENICTRWIM